MAGQRGISTTTPDHARHVESGDPDWAFIVPAPVAPDYQVCQSWLSPWSAGCAALIRSSLHGQADRGNRDDLLRAHVVERRSLTIADAIVGSSRLHDIAQRLPDRERGRPGGGVRVLPPVRGLRLQRAAGRTIPAASASRGADGACRADRHRHRRVALPRRPGRRASVPRRAFAQERTACGS